MATRNGSDRGAIKHVVLVHGGFVDGSGWKDVYRILKGRGYTVAVTQHPTHSLADDVAYVKRVIAAQDAPVVLVAHSYGGAVITEAGTDPHVAALVYVAAFAPDSGETVTSLLANPKPGAPVPPILPPKDDFLLLDPAKFAEAFAGDVSGEEASFMADSQLPWGIQAGATPISTPAWKSKPSWYLLTTEDRMIPPDTQRMMAKRACAAVVETKASHSVYVSQPEAVADLIDKAATSELALKERDKILAAVG